jgi:hypothetical protein
VLDDRSDEMLYSLRSVDFVSGYMLGVGNVAHQTTVRELSLGLALAIQTGYLGRNAAIVRRCSNSNTPRILPS